MYLERVSIRDGMLPLIFIAPHGFDDDFSGVIAMELAEQLNSYAVINNAWKRAANFDCSTSNANCNNITHLQNEVVKDEFLDPFLKFVDDACAGHGECDIVVVHGFVGKRPDIIFGYGEGNPSSHTINKLDRRLMMYAAQHVGFDVAFGKAGSKFAGVARNNLNQYHKKWQPAEHISSMQLEISKTRRIDDATAKATAKQLFPAFDIYLAHKYGISGPRHLPTIPDNWEAWAKTIPGV